MVALLWLVLVLAWIIGFAYTVLEWKRLACHENLPPGSMGFPFLGEVIPFLLSDPAAAVSPFIKERTERYGPIFKTRILGIPVIVSVDAEFNHFVLQQEGRQFQMWYPGVSRIFGEKSIGELRGPLHKYVRNLSLPIFGTETLRQSLLSELDEAVTENLSSWLSKQTLELKQATEHMIFNVTAKRLISYDSSTTGEDLCKPFMEFIHGIVSLPLDIPGTVFHRCLECRKKVMKILEKTLEDRMLIVESKPRQEPQDLLEVLLNETRKEGGKMSKEMALTLILSLLFASFETTSTTMTFAVKLLSDHPTVLEELTKEHDRILGEREKVKKWISWEEYKSMTYTSRVVDEVLRLSGLLVFRKSLQDVSKNGYTIPKGWAVVLYTPSVHADPDSFPDPFSFNPSRWEDSKVGRTHYLPFGGGPRLCVGMDFSKLLMAVFLHHLVTKYRWKKIQGGEVTSKPVLAFPNGFHIQLFQRT